MERLAYAITDHLLRRDVIQKEDYDIYVYGYAVFLEQMCQVIGFILLGIVTKNLLQTALFLGTFYLIRSAFGGYHAETSPVCMLVSYGGCGHDTFTVHGSICGSTTRALDCARRRSVCICDTRSGCTCQ